MKEIQLTQGQVAIVDDEDFEAASQWKWCAQRIGSKFYAVRHGRTIHPIINGKRTKREENIFLHVQIAGKRQGFQVDHKNRNTLDNRKSNLRQATASQNRMNRDKPYNRTGYKGVCKDRRPGRIGFFAYINANGVRTYLGWKFPTAEEAAVAYNKAAIQLHGEFAVINDNIGGIPWPTIQV